MNIGHVAYSHPPQPAKELVSLDSTGRRVSYRLSMLDGRVALYSLVGLSETDAPPKIGPAQLYGALAIQDETRTATQAFTPWMMVEKLGRGTEPQVLCGIKKAGNGGHAYLIAYSITQQKFSYIRCNHARAVAQRSPHDLPAIEELYKAFVRQENDNWAVKKGLPTSQQRMEAGGAAKLEGDDGSRGRKWTEEEDKLMIAAVDEYHKAGRKIDWSEVSKKIPGRTTTQVTCHWHNTVKPKLNPGKFAPRGKIIGVAPTEDKGEEEVAQPVKKVKTEEGSLPRVVELKGAGEAGNRNRKTPATEANRSVPRMTSPKPPNAKGPRSGEGASGSNPGSAGSSTKKKKKKQLDHDRPFICPYPGCGSGFTRRFDMGRHCERIHGMKLAEIRAKVLNGEFGQEAMVTAQKDTYEANPSTSSAHVQAASAPPSNAQASTSGTPPFEKATGADLSMLAESVLQSANLRETATSALEPGLEDMPVLKVYDVNEIPKVNDKKLSDLFSRFKDISQLAIDAVGGESEGKHTLDALSKGSQGDAPVAKGGPQPHSATAYYLKLSTLEQYARNLRSNLRDIERDIDTARYQASGGDRSAADSEWFALAKQRLVPHRVAATWSASETIRRTQPSLGLYGFVG